MLCTPDPTSTPPVHTACTRYAHMLYHHYPVLPSTVPTWATTMGLVCALNPSLSHHGTLSQRHATKYSVHSGSTYALYPGIWLDHCNPVLPSTSPYGCIPVPYSVLLQYLHAPGTHPIPSPSGCGWLSQYGTAPSTALYAVLYCTSYPWYSLLAIPVLEASH